jgi:hypothetical protein
MYQMPYVFNVKQFYYFQRSSVPVLPKMISKVRYQMPDGLNDLQSVSLFDAQCLQR